MKRLKNFKAERRNRIKRKLKAGLSGAANKPRLSIFRSNKHIYAQIIDDSLGRTLVSASDLEMRDGAKMSRAGKVGLAVGRAAKTKNIKKVVFDRSGYKYAGRVKSLADGVRKEGLEF